MVWEHSIYLYTLVIIPILILGVWFKVRSMRQRAEQYFEADQKERLQLGYVPIRATIKHGVFLLGMTFLIMA